MTHRGHFMALQARYKKRGRPVQRQAGRKRTRLGRGGSRVRLLIPQLPVITPTGYSNYQRGPNEVCQMTAKACWVVDARNNRVGIVAAYRACGL
jgi:hypothetical protein